jgi:GAF domain-containing protein
MRRYVVKENVKHFERLLQSEADERKYALLDQMLSDARHELSRLEGIWSWTCPHVRVPLEVGLAAENLLELIAQKHQADFGSLQLWDRTAGGLCLIAHHNFDGRSAERFAVVRDGDGTVCEAAQASQAPVIIDDIEREQLFASLRDWRRHMGIRAIHTTPLFDRTGKFIGAFSMHYARSRSSTSLEHQMYSAHAGQFSRLFANVQRT